ncbi:hypothetical protein PR048_003371 [Dryococelus australis]|uniref:Uncharacterized protein n=1 Tax=Dryococelus australis TaxID=614101 RepID=A0ABQ9INU8_9NEOP|nr:hypothetical protein PR048_003371 [Dryococelus australis]
MERFRTCKDGANGRSPRKPADQRHHPARFPLAKMRSDPAGEWARFVLVGVMAYTSEPLDGLYPLGLGCWGLVGKEGGGGRLASKSTVILRTQLNAVGSVHRVDHQLVGDSEKPAEICGNTTSAACRRGRWRPTNDVRSAELFTLSGQACGGALLDGENCSPPTKANRATPARSLRIFASENRAGRCHWSVGFLGDLPFDSKAVKKQRTDLYKYNASKGRECKGRECLSARTEGRERERERDPTRRALQLIGHDWSELQEYLLLATEQVRNAAISVLTAGLCWGSSGSGFIFLPAFRNETYSVPSPRKPSHFALGYLKQRAFTSCLKPDVSNYQTWYEIWPYKAENAMAGATLARIPAAVEDLAQAFKESGIITSSPPRTSHKIERNLLYPRWNREEHIPADVSCYAYSRQEVDFKKCSLYGEQPLGRSEHDVKVECLLGNARDKPREIRRRQEGRQAGWARLLRACKTDRLHGHQLLLHGEVVRSWPRAFSTSSCRSSLRRTTLPLACVTATLTEDHMRYCTIPDSAKACARSAIAAVIRASVAPVMAFPALCYRFRTSRADCTDQPTYPPCAEAVCARWGTDKGEIPVFLCGSSQREGLAGGAAAVLTRRKAPKGSQQTQPVGKVSARYLHCRRLSFQCQKIAI